MSLGIGLHYDIPASEYHADPAERPSLSCSIAAKLVQETPQHAWRAHPRLGGRREEEEVAEDPEAAKVKQRGSVIHELLLGGGKGIVVLPPEFENFKKKAAQDIRDAALAEGKVPMIAHKMESYEIAARIIQAKLELRGYSLSGFEGDREVTAIWEEDGVLCRCRFDFLGERGILDIKTRWRIKPRFLARTMEDYHEHMSYVVYRRALKAITGTDAPMRFAYCEFTEPYEPIVVYPSEALAELGERDWAFAKALWRGCTETNSWPGHPLEDVAVSPNALQLARLEEGDIE